MRSRRRLVRDFASPDEDGGDDWKPNYNTSPVALFSRTAYGRNADLNNDPDFAGFAFNEMANRIPGYR